MYLSIGSDRIGVQSRDVYRTSHMISYRRGFLFFYRAVEENEKKRKDGIFMDRLVKEEGRD